MFLQVGHEVLTVPTSKLEAVKAYLRENKCVLADYGQVAGYNFAVVERSVNV